MKIDKAKQRLFYRHLYLALSNNTFDSGPPLKDLFELVGSRAEIGNKIILHAFLLLKWESLLKYTGMDYNTIYHEWPYWCLEQIAKNGY